MTMKVIPPGSTVGILGGGQLGKMSAAAAHSLGYTTVVWGQSEQEPALQACTYRVIAPFTDPDAFAEFCERAHVVTTEWENIPVSLLRKMEEKGVLVRPSSRVLEVAQSRRAEKEFARFIGAEPVPHRCIGGVEALQDADDYSELFPGILKTDRLGYDGRGQAAISDHSALVEAMERFAAPCVLEKRMPLDFEASILVARTSPHHIRVSSIVKNVHQGGILVETRWDRSMDRCQIAELGFAKIAADAAEALDLHGILAIEFFVSGGKLFFNEMAPRPHNSFHGSIEAARTSQFEQHIRAICGLPLGDVVFRTPFRMVNLLGDDWRQWEEYIDGDKVHLYGKSEPRPGRKMGHVTLLDVP